MFLFIKIKSIYFYVFDLFRKVLHIGESLSRIQESLGRIENRQINSSSSLSSHLSPSYIHASEFKVFSQWGEDGVIQSLVRDTEIKNKIFVEFGVQDFVESNTRFLLINNNWSGLIMDCSRENVNYIKRDKIYWQYNLKAECAFIYRENINSLLVQNGVVGDIGLLSIDIDGNDYWIWQAIDCIFPRIVICEYNSLFGSSRKVTIPYDQYFTRRNAHFSNLYYGASISALNHLANSKGYALLGSNTAGNNLFFLRNDLLREHFIHTPETAYVKSQFKESRDINGNLSYLGFDDRIKIISHMPLYDIEANKFLEVGDL